MGSGSKKYKSKKSAKNDINPQNTSNKSLVKNWCDSYSPPGLEPDFVPDKKIRGWVASFWSDEKNDWEVCKFFRRKIDIPKGAIAILRGHSYTSWQE